MGFNFNDDDGKFSIMRFNTTLLVWGGILIALVTVIFKMFFDLAGDTGENFKFSISLITIGIAGKGGQKFAESINKKKNG